jgi:multidrug resistance efflux pump
LAQAVINLKDGIDSEQLAVLEARLNAAKAGVAAFSVIAPFDGVVAGMKAKAGSSINVVELTEGQPVIVTLDALPDVELKGEILSIGQSYAENQGDIVYEVTIILIDTHPGMRWG